MTVRVPTAAIIGHPVAHSLSPRIHRHWLRGLGIAGDYLAHDVAPADLPDAVKRFADDGYRGLNVTIPHKESALALCDDLSPAARAVGAVNTLVFKEGKIFGDNTDAAGFAAHLTHEIPNQKFMHAIIIGAGGAARAIVFALKTLGAENFTLINRDTARAEKLMSDLNVSGHAKQFSNSCLMPHASCLVNCTPLGMAGQPPLEMDLSGLPPETVIADIVYRPLQTGLLKTAAARGHKTVDGLGMLIRQAALSFEQFYGARPDIKQDLRNLLERELSDS